MTTDLTAPCPRCGFHRDTPNHVHGCPPPDPRTQPTDDGRAAMRTAIFNDLLESAKAFPDLHAALSGLRPGTVAAVVDCITDTVLELRA